MNKGVKPSPERRFLGICVLTTSLLDRIQDCPKCEARRGAATFPPSPRTSTSRRSLCVLTMTVLPSDGDPALEIVNRRLGGISMAGPVALDESARRLPTPGPILHPSLPAAYSSTLSSPLLYISCRHGQVEPGPVAASIPTAPRPVHPQVPREPDEDVLGAHDGYAQRAAPGDQRETL